MNKMYKFIFLAIVTLSLCTSSLANSQDEGLTADEAQELVEVWLANHGFPFEVSFDSEWLTPETSRIDGKDYYMATLFSDGDWFNDIFIDKETGEMTASNSYINNTVLVDPMPLDEWYESIMANIRKYQETQTMPQAYDEAAFDGDDNSDSREVSNNKQTGAVYTLEFPSRRRASSGNLYDAPMELVRLSFIHKVNIQNPERVRHGCKIRILTGKNNLGMYEAYDIDEDGNPGGTIYTVVDAIVID